MKYQGIEVPESVVQKFYAYRAKDRMPADRGIESYLWKSNPVNIGPELRGGLAWFFNCSPAEDVWVRSSQAGPHFCLVFIGFQASVIEIGSWRTLRQMGKLALKMWLERRPSGKPEAMRYAQIGEPKWVRPPIRGGLMRQETQPKKRPVRDGKPYEYIEPEYRY